jgi:hypothetical protein
LIEAHFWFRLYCCSADQSRFQIRYSFHFVTRQLSLRLYYFKDAIK